VGPTIAAIGFVLYARPGIGGSYWTTFFPAGRGAGVRDGGDGRAAHDDGDGARSIRGMPAWLPVSQRGSRGVAGLLLRLLFLASCSPGRSTRACGRVSIASRFHQPPEKRVDRELRKIAGADVTQLSSIPSPERLVVRVIIDEGFVFAFRLVMTLAAGLALAAADPGTPFARVDRPLALPGCLPRAAGRAPCRSFRTWPPAGDSLRLRRGR